MPSLSEIVTLLLAPLKMSLGAVFFIAGAYSLIFNASDARSKKMPKAEKAARLGGWAYLAFGAALIIAGLI